MRQQQAGAEKVRAKLVEGAKFPDFDVKDLADKPLSIANYKGKVVLLDFWATWCGPCRQELPNVLKTYKAHHKDGFEILGISLDKDREALTTFIKEERHDLAAVFRRQVLAERAGRSNTASTVSRRPTCWTAKGPSLARIYAGRASRRRSPRRWPRNSGGGLVQTLVNTKSGAPAHRRAKATAALSSPLCRVVMPGHLGPVHHVPERLEVIRAAVLVLEVVGVFPDVAAEDRLAFGTRRPPCP